jgi:hypothetical protein
MNCSKDDLGITCDNCICKYKVVAVIPCLGRYKLLKKTIERLYKVNRVTKVVLIGEERQVERIAAETGSIYLRHTNSPLGKKWNAGFIEARKLNPDAILFVGSSDWISEDWLTEALKHLKDHDLIGRLDCYLLDFNTISGKRLVYWPGYGQGVRSEEPIGIGRVISARILDKIDWKPFNDDRDNSMDWFMYEAVLNNQGTVKIMDNGKSMAISTNLWGNKHQFEQHWSGKELPSTKIKGEEMNSFLVNNFPESIHLF